MTGLLAAVVIVGALAVIAASVVGLMGFKAWLAYRREGRKDEPAADILRRLTELETKASAAEMAKLRR